MAEEKREASESREEANEHTTSGWWADNLLLGTLATGAALFLFDITPLSVPIIASLCCGFGAMAIGRAYEEKKWIQLIVALIVVVFVGLCASDSRICLYLKQQNEIPVDNIGNHLHCN